MRIGMTPGVTSALVTPERKALQQSLLFSGGGEQAQKGSGLKKAMLPALMALVGFSAPVWADPPATTPPSQEAPKAQAAEEAPPKLTEDDLIEKLKTEGLKGPVHGAVTAENKYVFTVIDPNDFLNQLHFPLLLPKPSDNAEATKKRDQIAETLKNLHRHDRILVKGTFESKAGVKHIRLSDLTVTKEFTGFPKNVPMDNELKVPTDLLEKNEFVGVVHAQVNDGKMLIVEYGKSVNPIVIHNAEPVKELWRGDIVKIHYKVQRHPGQPPHLVLATDLPKDQKSIEVIKPLMDLRGKTFTDKETNTDNNTKKDKDPNQLPALKGSLVLFVNSPVLTRRTWALETTDDNGLKRYFFLLNPDNQEDWDKMDQQFQDWWDADKAGIVMSRNKQINRNIQLKITEGKVPALPEEKDAKTPEELQEVRYIREVSVNQGYLNLHTTMESVKLVEKEAAKP